MKKVRFTSFIKENIDKVIPSVLVLSMVSLGAYVIADTNYRSNVLDEVSQKSYVSQNEKSYSVDDLFFIEKDNKFYYCEQTKLDGDVSYHYSIIPNVLGSHLRRKNSSVYQYTNVDTGEIVCTSNDGCGAIISELEDILLDDVVTDEVELENIDQKYLVKKIDGK